MAAVALMPQAARGSGLAANICDVAAIVSGAKRYIRQRQEDTIEGENTQVWMTAGREIRAWY